MVRADEVVLEVRNSAFGRIGQIDLGYVSGGKFVKRANAVGAWQFTLPNEHPAASILKMTGYGIVLWLNDDVYQSGPMIQWTKTETNEDPLGTTTFVGGDDLLTLADRLAYPVPESADVTNGQTAAYDVRTGPAETILLGYVAANVTGAPAARQDQFSSVLALPDDQGRGKRLTYNARFDQVGAVAAEIAAQDGTLGFDVRQDENRPGTNLTIYTIQDRSGTVRMDIDNNLLSSTASGISAPKVTRPIVAGQGQGELRQFVEVTDAESIEAEGLWGRRIESFLDQRQTNVVEELTESGLKVLAEGGRTVVSLKVVPSDGATMRYGVDWRTGDRVGVVVDDQVLTDVVSEAILTIDEADVRVGATIGDPVGYEWEAAVTAALTDHSGRISRLERLT